MANDGGMRRAVERSALGSVGVHFWGFFCEFFRSLQSDSLAFICYVSEFLSYNKDFFSEDSFFDPKPNAGAFGQSLNFLTIFTGWPVF